VPLVQVWSRQRKEWSFIYVRPTPETSRLELMILAHDDSDTITTLVRVEVDANVLARELKDKPRDVTNMARR
jgi:hypothetical protein